MVNNAIDISNSGFNQSKKTSVNPYFGYLYQFGQIQGYQLKEKIYPNMANNIYFVIHISKLKP